MVVAFFVVFGFVAAGVYAAQRPRSKPPKVVAAETPSWALEADPGEAESTSTPRSRSAARPERGAVTLDEVITPEQVRVANTTPCAAKPAHIVNVRDFGARGDGLSDDSVPIQRANNAVSIGGGRVVFPPGLYRVYNVQQSSCVEFRGEGGATLIHPDGTSPRDVIKSRITRTSGSIDLNSRVLRVASTSGIRRGAVVAIRGAGGRSRIQRTTLEANAPPYVNSIAVRTTKGMNRTSTNYLFLENEIVSYKGIWQNRLTNVKRGLLGTRQVNHQSGSVVAQAQRRYAVVVAVSGKRVILDSVSRSALRDTEVEIGSVGMTVDGLTIDGNRRTPGSTATNPFPLRYDLARWVSVRNSTIRNGDHGGIALREGTRDSVIEGNTLSDHGDPSRGLGAGVWLFQGATRNVVRENSIYGRTFIGVMIDDRSVYASEYDAESNGNTIADNTIDIDSFSPRLNAGVVISGSRETMVRGNTMGHSTTGIMVGEWDQGNVVSPTVLNHVIGNTFDTHKAGVVVSGSDNEFVRNLIRHADQAVDDSGRRNRFIDNRFE